MNRRSDIEALTPGLRRYARGLTGCAETADDLTQDALLSAIRSSGLGRGSALRRRLYAILTDFNRMRVAGLSNPDAYGGENRGVVRLFNRRDGAAAIASGPDPLAAMSLGEREALLLVAVESFAYDEAADIRLRIPLRSGARSLNVALAASMVVSEALRQTDGFHA